MKTVFSSFFLCLAIAGFGQALNDTVRLRELEVSGRRLSLNFAGKKELTVDSVVLISNQLRTLADLLEAGSSVALKPYGVNGVVTAGARGASADHTTVIWNGLALQSPTHGQYDFSLFPVFLLSSATIEPGAAGSAYGSGAIGGSVILNTDDRSTSDKKIEAIISAGSFGKRAGGLKASFTRGRLRSGSAFYCNSQKNNYPVRSFFIPQYNNYYRLDGPVRLNRGDFHQYGALQEFTLKITPDQELHNGFMYLECSRPMINSAAWQRDRSFRNYLRWKYVKNLWRAEFSAGIQSELLHYEDTSLNIDSRGRTMQGIAHAALYRTFEKYGRAQFHAEVQAIRSRLNEYQSGEVAQIRNSIWLGWTKSFRGDHLTVEVGGRQQWQSGRPFPFIPSLGIQVLLLPSVWIKAHRSAMYHTPDLNDLYWHPGGNPALLPETGWADEAGILYKRDHFSAEITAFSSRTTNLIVWVPGQYYWSAQNIKQVNSKGLETNISLSKHFRKHLYSIALHYTGVISETTQSTRPGDASLGKQLMYIPRSKVTTALSWSWMKWLLSGNASYTGKRFINSDNSNWLPSQLIFNLRVSYKFLFKSLAAEPFAACYNAGDFFYMSMPGFPMPGRSFELGIQLKIK